MLNSKIEKVVICIVGYFVLIMYALILPEQRFNFETTVLCCFSTTIITIGVFYLYLRIRNHCVLKRINTYLVLNKYDDCLIYLEKCINKNKKIVWLRFEKLLVIALKGDITDFKAYYYEIKGLNYSGKKKYLDNIINFEQLFSYLTNAIIPNYTCATSIESAYLEKLMHILSQKEKMNHDEIITYAFEIYNSPFFLYKSVSALILSEQYSSFGDYNNGQLFAQKAKQYAPSQEILFCITQHLERSKDKE